MSVPDLLARLLTRPGALEALQHRDTAALERELGAEPADVAAIAALDPDAVRFYLRTLQRKRFEMIEAVFPGSLPLAREAFGSDRLADAFWRWFQPDESVAADEVLGRIAQAWTQFAGTVDPDRPWLADLSRYELLRWRAVLEAAPSGPVRPVYSGDRLVPAPGAGMAVFAVDVALLARTAMAGEPVATAGTHRLIVWFDPDAGLRVVRLGPSAYAAAEGCDGRRTIAQVAHMVAGDRKPAAGQVVDVLARLAAAGALRVS